ncbi:MAG TPA: hypothetical protein VHW01_06465, partial [Polyangiaceae bacterium]|nr:hypothetical protein [Polyangiaceae bacterium]
MFASSLLIFFIGFAFAASVAWVANLRRRAERAVWQRSVAFSTAAVVPAFLLLVESSARVFHRWVVPGTVVYPYDFVAVAPCLLWILVGPVLFLKSFIPRVRRRPCGVV